MTAADPGRYSLVLRDQPHPLAAETAQFFADLDTKHRTAQLATAGEVMTRQDAPSLVLYPSADVDVCEHCFRPSPTLSTTGDPAVAPAGGPLVRCCWPCHAAARNGTPAPLPSGDELAELLVSWARWDVNGDVAEEFTDRALAVLVPRLDEQARSEALGELQDALIWQQEVNTPGYDHLQHEPEVRDVETLQARADERVDEAVQALIGGAR